MRTFPVFFAISMTALCSLPAVAGAQGRRMRLARDTVIDNITCAATGQAYAEWHANGRLLECPLSRDSVLWGHRLPAGTWIELDAHGGPVGGWLATDTWLSGHRCRGDGYKQWAIRFHRNGALALCFLREDTVIDGVPCLRGTFWNEVRGGSRTGVVFDESGRAERCQASRPFTRNGQRYRKWDLVRLRTPAAAPSAAH